MSPSGGAGVCSDVQDKCMCLLIGYNLLRHLVQNEDEDGSFALEVNVIKGCANGPLPPLIERVVRLHLAWRASQLGRILDGDLLDFSDISGAAQVFYQSFVDQFRSVVRYVAHLQCGPSLLHVHVPMVTSAV